MCSISVTIGGVIGLLYSPTIWESFNRIKSIDENNKFIRAKLIIPCNKKQEILKQLKALGISQETLFADNIDIVCSELKNDIESRL